MKERVVRFGPNDGITGILSEASSPESARETRSAVGVVLLNAGLLSHAGPFDWAVTLARRIANRGLHVLRFDLSGLGDSLPRQDGSSEIERVLLDIQDALNHLTRVKGVDRFVILGLCSGASFAHQAAVRDPRIVGAVFLDGYSYPTPGYHRRYYLARMFRLDSWLGMARRLIGRVLPSLRPAAAAAPGLLLDQHFVEDPPLEKARADLAALVQRGVHLFFIYTGSQALHTFNARHQFEEMYGVLDPTGQQVRCDYDPLADHLYSDFSDRESLFTRLEDWLGEPEA